MPTARYETSSSADGGAYASWLGDNPANYMEWRDVYSFIGGKYRLTIAYASGSARNLEVYVNGKLIRTIRGLNNGSWNGSWGKANVNIELEPGSNSIRLGNGSGFAPNIDYIQLRRTGDSDAVAAPFEDTDEGVSVYDLQGRKMVNGKYSKGLNIIRYPNKKSKKVMVK